MAKKVQVVLDDDTYRLLEELSHSRAGNKSVVVREALRYFADRETIERALDGILAQRHAREAMEAGIEARNQDRFLPQASVVGGFAGSRKRGGNSPRDRHAPTGLAKTEPPHPKPLAELGFSAPPCPLPAERDKRSTCPLLLT